MSSVTPLRKTGFSLARASIYTAACSLLWPRLAGTVLLPPSTWYRSMTHAPTHTQTGTELCRSVTVLKDVSVLRVVPPHYSRCTVKTTSEVAALLLGRMGATSAQPSPYASLVRDGEESAWTVGGVRDQNVWGLPRVGGGLLAGSKKRN